MIRLTPNFSVTGPVFFQKDAGFGLKKTCVAPRILVLPEIRTSRNSKKGV